MVRLGLQIGLVLETGTQWEWYRQGRVFSPLCPSLVASKPHGNGTHYNWYRIELGHLDWYSVGLGHNETGIQWDT